MLPLAQNVVFEALYTSNDVLFYSIQMVIIVLPLLFKNLRYLRH